MEDFEYINKELQTCYKSNKDIDWGFISSEKILSESFIEKFQNEVNWGFISAHQNLSEAFIEKFQNKINWSLISAHQKLSENFIKKYINKLDSFYISMYQKLSESFIQNNFHNLNIETLLMTHAFSEEFIEKNYSIVFKYPYAKYWIFKYQKLSEKFIERHQGYMLSQALTYQKFSDEFIKKYNLKVDKENLWQYQSEKFKKEEIVNSKRFECYDDHFIAYKAIRPDRYSFYNFQYQYFPGKTYESTCDCTSKENSFGLNVGTYDCAKSYLKRYKDGIIVKCKVYYKDVGRLSYFMYSARCFKITILE